MEFIAHIYKDEPQMCTDHCRNTAKYASDSLKEIGFSSLGYISGLLHDCGKFTIQFSDYIKAAASGENVRKGEVIHSFAGVFLILNRYFSSDNDFIKNTTAEIIAYAIGSHHGLFDIYNENHESGFIHRLKKQPDYEKEAIENFFKECISKDDLDLLFYAAVKEVRLFFETAAELTDAADEMFFYCSCLLRLLTSAVINGDRTDTAEFMHTAPVNTTAKPNADFWRVLKEKTESKLSKFPTDTPIREARSQLSEICSSFAGNGTGIYRLNLPTGAGKTLIGLRYALNHAYLNNKHRIIYVAPLITILEQNSEVWSSYLGYEYILEHHSDVVVEEEDTEAFSMRNMLIDTWDSPVIITTLVQLLNTLFFGKTSNVRRMQSLIGSIIIFDEVQTVPAKMLTLFNLTLNFLSRVCGATILLCSATQPCFEKTEHPLLVSDMEFLSHEEQKKYNKIFQRNILVDEGELSLAEIASLAEKRLEEFGSVLVVCNKKSESEVLFNLIQLNDAYKFHLSASMCVAHRQDVLKEMTGCLAARQKLICVSTQVIEAGVDISFGTVIRLTAGMDNIIQSAGRCNRNGERTTDAPVSVVTCSGENLQRIKEIKEAKDASIALLTEFRNDRDRFNGNLLSDPSIAFYYKQLYKRMDKGYCDFNILHKPSIYSLMSDNTQYADGADGVGVYYLSQALKTAGELFEVFDNSSYPVVVPYGEGAELIGELIGLSPEHDFEEIKKSLKKIKKYTVNIYDYQYRAMVENGTLFPVCGGMFLTICDSEYDMNTGIKTKRSETENCSILIL